MFRNQENEGPNYLNQIVNKYCMVVYITINTSSKDKVTYAFLTKKSYVCFCSLRKGIDVEYVFYM